MILEYSRMTTISLTIFAFLFPFCMTALGAFLSLTINKNSTLASIVATGLSAGIMLSASIWSLLLPAINQSKSIFEQAQFVPILCGFAFGGIFMILMNIFCDKIFKNNNRNKSPYTIFTAVTIHNIPEGLAIGFTLGSAIATQSQFLGAVSIILGIGIQNLPEGLATAITMQNCMKTRKKSIFLGILSGIVEPIFAIIGFLSASHISFALPWLLSFASGTMIFVVIEELMPQLCENKGNSLGTISFLVGFLGITLLETFL